MSSTSVFELFKIGIGPSSSHTVGPMVAAKRFATQLQSAELLESLGYVRCELFGSLGATGRGHGSDKAVILGLMGEDPKTTDTRLADERVETILRQESLSILGLKSVPFRDREHLQMHKRRSLPYHPNGMRFTAMADDDTVLLERYYYSVGGGFVVNEKAVAGDDPLKEDTIELPHPFNSAVQLLDICATQGMAISDVVMENEKRRSSDKDIRGDLLEIFEVMRQCVDNGSTTGGLLPGGLKVKRRAQEARRRLEEASGQKSSPLSIMDWVNMYALAINEENAAGGRVVTAPTNGAAGIVPAVLLYYFNHCDNANEDGVVRFLLTAGAIGMLFKMNASISGAEVGCQGEVGSACSMAAAGLTEVLGGTPNQVENAAEIGIEHNLGLTCDPIGGLVQIPCIERNAMASIKAINAAHLALGGDGTHYVSLDKAIKTMRDTGRDMKVKYKETSRGGLAVNVVDVPVNIVEC
ncbi:MAG: L-serine dehydratase [marine bacterium B5-7]|nr:MAG: L-serine dehydratase [marine bacterium B5-7]